MRRPAAYPQRPCLWLPDCRGNRCRRCCQRPVPRGLELHDAAGWWGIDLAGLVHRDVPHSAAGAGGHHASGGQAQVDIPGAGRYWPRLLRGRNDR